MPDPKSILKTLFCASRWRVSTINTAGPWRFSRRDQITTLASLSALTGHSGLYLACLQEVPDVSSTPQRKKKEMCVLPDDNSETSFSNATVTS